MFVVIFKKYVLSMSLSFYGREFCEIAPLTSRDGQPCLVAMMLLVWRPPPSVQSFAYQTGRQNENQTQPRNPQELRKRYHMVVSSPDRRVREALRDNAGGELAEYRGCMVELRKPKDIIGCNSIRSGTSSGSNSSHTSLPSHPRHPRAVCADCRTSIPATRALALCCLAAKVGAQHPRQQHLHRQPVPLCAA